MQKVLIYVGIIILFLLTMISPALQIVFSSSKKKYIWLIMPVITLISFTAIALFSSWSIITKILFSLCVPTILIIFHILVKKNIFH